MGLFQSGKWLNTYELPFFNNTYLQANENQNWTTGALSQTTKGNAGVTEFLKEGLNIDLPMKPEFHLNNIGDCRI